MLDVTYEIVQHDGDWAYKVNGVFSEPLPTHAEALAAAFNCFVSQSLHQQNSSSRFPAWEYERRSLAARFQQIYCVQQIYRGFIAARSGEY